MRIWRFLSTDQQGVMLSLSTFICGEKISQIWSILDWFLALLNFFDKLLAGISICITLNKQLFIYRSLIINVRFW